MATRELPLTLADFRYQHRHHATKTVQFVTQNLDVLVR